MTKEDRAWGVAQYEVLKEKIDKGEWIYSPSALASEFSAYKRINRRSTMLTLILLIICLGPIIFIFGLVGFLIALCVLIGATVEHYVGSKKAEKYEVHLNRLKTNGKMSKPSSINLKGISDELKDLAQLKEKGLISDEEYKAAKEKVLR